MANEIVMSSIQIILVYCARGNRLSRDGLAVAVLSDKRIGLSRARRL